MPHCRDRDLMRSGNFFRACTAQQADRYADLGCGHTQRLGVRLQTGSLARRDAPENDDIQAALGWFVGVDKGLTATGTGCSRLPRKTSLR